MRLVPTPLEGVVVIEARCVSDQRGSFVRAWDASDFREAGLDGLLDQCNVSRNHRRGTLRGLHWQEAPREESKFVRCVRGRVFDVAVHVRPGPTYLQWWGLELDARSDRGLYIPAGYAHGFLTLEDDTDVEYLMTGNYSPEHARGLRYDDPAIGVTWPSDVVTVSTRDLAFPLVVRS